MQQYNEACAPAEDPQARRPVHVFYPRRDDLALMEEPGCLTVILYIQWTMSRTLLLHSEQLG